MICNKCGIEVKRVRMPKTRSSVTHKVKIGNASYYIRVGLIDEKPMEVFINEGKADNAMLDQWARAVSLLLQYGLTTRELVSKFAWTKFDPRGMTDNPDIRTAHSVPDYVARWIDGKWGTK
jgi:ribonucleoside-diphosphate reductase alpha chain